MHGNRSLKFCLLLRWDCVEERHEVKKDANKELKSDKTGNKQGLRK